jgi:hypothetical protein
MLLAQAQAQASSSATSSEQEMDICIDEVPVAVEAKKPKRPWILRYASTVASTARERGIGAGLAFAVLGGVSGLQTSLSGLIPGLEFTTALQAATQVHADIVLADQVVEDTLNNIGNLPATSVRMWRDLLQTGSWHDTFGKEAAALQTAIAGNSKFQPHQLTLPAFLTRSKVSLEEGIRSTVVRSHCVVWKGDDFRFLQVNAVLLLCHRESSLTLVCLLSLCQQPPFLLLQLFAASANTVAEQVVNPAVATAAFAADVAVSASLPVTADPTTPESLALNVFNFAVLAIGYISVALPAARVVLRERDDQLTAGIQQACRLAVQSKGKGRLGINSSTPPKVVAVLGLLHVNGVAQRILSAAATPQTGAMPRITSREILGERSLVQGDGASS